MQGAGVLKAVQQRLAVIHGDAVRDVFNRRTPRRAENFCEQALTAAAQHATAELVARKDGAVKQQRPHSGRR